MHIKYYTINAPQKNNELYLLHILSSFPLFYTLLSYFSSAQILDA
jgi:hypothetical protein